MTDVWTRPRPGARGYRRDAVAAAVLLLGTVTTTLLYTRVGFYSEPAPFWLTAAVVLGLTAPLVLRRRHPEAVAVVVAIAFFVGQQFSVPELLFSNITLFIAIYSIGAWSQHRRAADVTRMVIIVAMFVWIAVNVFTSVGDPGTTPGVSHSGVFSQFAALAVIQFITNLLYFGGAYFFGNAAFASARARAELEARTLELARERERSAEQAVALDRVNIARELHDIVAHHVSVMGVQAGAARRVLDSNPAQASESLTLIERNAREAVDELHQLLTTLRGNENGTDSAGAGASTLGIEQLPELVQETNAAGVPATFQVVGDAHPVTSITGFTLYRIAQEALTNVRKHAGVGATADVRLRYEPGSVELEITDTGTGGRHSVTNDGLGHLGMKERIAAVGGSLEIGPRARGGYLVRAAVPATDSEVPA